MRDQLRWAAEVIAAANDEDLLTISAADDAPELFRHRAAWPVAERLAARRAAADRARWRFPRSAVSDGI